MAGCYLKHVLPPPIPLVSETDILELNFDARPQWLDAKNLGRSFFGPDFCGYDATRFFCTCYSYSKVAYCHAEFFPRPKYWLPRQPETTVVHGYFDARGIAD